jgi:glyoxylase-like metal-dependent hydrolase (beta-lactamase superfamily II)
MEKRLHSVLGNSQKLDGGAMFGNAPKALWAKWSPPDEQNRIDLACRALLVREPHRNILFETGIGAFFSPELRARFGVNEAEHVLLQSLSKIGLRDSDIDVVVLSHLHFDHAGGLLAPYQEGQAPRLLFPRAHFVVGKEAFERAIHPHARDRASFISELPGLLEDSGRLEIVTGDTSQVLGAGYRLHISHGHTPGMMLAEVEGDRGPVLFAADLIPGRPWVRAAITMGYDRYPELLIDEKSRLLESLFERHGRVFYTHDPACAMSELSRNERGQIEAGRAFVNLEGEAA